MGLNQISTSEPTQERAARPASRALSRVVPCQVVKSPELKIRIFDRSSADLSHSETMIIRWFFFSNTTGRDLAKRHELLVTYQSLVFAHSQVIIQIEHGRNA